MANYTELKDMQAPCDDCFFAFSKSQLDEGIAKLEGKKVYSAGKVFGGLFGTKEGLDKFLNFYVELEKRIASECDPQEVYDYEFSNHECEYLWDDTEAIKIVISYFGKERAKEVKRRCVHKQIDDISTKDLF